MPNIEIKSKIPDLKHIKNQLSLMSTKHVGLDHQIDTYFKTQEGRFKLRESSLSGAYLVPYIRPNSLGPKKSDYLKIPVEDAQKTKELFSQLFGIIKVVEKKRDIYLIENVRVHLDQVETLGEFLEFEAVYSDPLQEESERKKVQDLLDKFQITEQDLIKNSYSDLV